MDTWNRKHMKMERPKSCCTAYNFTHAQKHIRTSSCSAGQLFDIISSKSDITA